MIVPQFWRWRRLSFFGCGIISDFVHCSDQVWFPNAHATNISVSFSHPCFLNKGSCEGGLLPAAWNAHDKRQTPDTNCSITDQLLADGSCRRASWTQSRRSTRLRALVSRLRLWKDSLADVPASVKMGQEVAESLPAGSGEDWLCWRALNRLRTGVGRAKTVMRRWGYLDDAHSVDCDCGEPQTMSHLVSCRLLDEACTTDDLDTVTERAQACARKWEKIVWRTRQKKTRALKGISCRCIPILMTGTDVSTSSLRIGTPAFPIVRFSCSKNSFSYGTCKKPTKSIAIG